MPQLSKSITIYIPLVKSDLDGLEEDIRERGRSVVNRQPAEAIDIELGRLVDKLDKVISRYQR